jgi:glycosyltransferase involved in cell wall biosynthesis
MISIGIPAFKTKYLRLSIESVLKQTFPDFELIIVNSYANVEIREIVKQFEDYRIKYFESKESLDIVDNWNKVLSYATGEYFILFSDDDIYESTFLEELYALTSKHKTCNIYYCRTQQISSIGDIITFSVLCPEYEIGIDFIWGRLFGGRLQYAAEFMCRTNELRKIGGFYKFPLAWGTDDVTWFLLASSNGIAYCEKALFNFRMSELNISKVGNFEQRLLAIEQYKAWISNYLDIYDSKSCYEYKIINNIKQNYNKNIESKNKDMVYYSSLNNNYLFHIYYFLKLKKRYKLKLYWLLSTLVYKLFSK